MFDCFRPKQLVQYSKIDSIIDEDQKIDNYSWHGQRLKMFDCFRPKQLVQYSIIDEDQNIDNYKTFNIISCKISNRYQTDDLTHIGNIQLTKNGLFLKSINIKYEHISFFDMISNRTVIIYLYGTYANNRYIFSDNPLAIKCTFTSNNNKDLFIKTIFTVINEIKKSNNYDKSTHTFKSMKYFLLSRKLKQLSLKKRQIAGNTE